MQQRTLHNHYYCRYMLGLAGVPSVIQFIGFIWLPESPRWLMEKGRSEEARSALKQIRRVDNVDAEIQDIEEAVESSKKLQDEGLQIMLLNPFPNKPWFLCVCCTSLLKTLWEKEKLLVMSNFSFSHSVFFQSRDLSAIFIKFVVVCKLFQFGGV